MFVLTVLENSFSEEGFDKFVLINKSFVIFNLFGSVFVLFLKDSSVWVWFSFFDSIFFSFSSNWIPSNSSNFGGLYRLFYSPIFNLLFLLKFKLAIKKKI